MARSIFNVVRASEPASPSAERVALAREIEAKREKDRRLAMLELALETAWRSVRNSERAVADAKAAVETAKVEAANHLVAVATGAGGDAPVSIRTARGNLTDAEDGLEVATAARDALRQQHADATRNPEWQTDHVRNAALAVLRVEAADAALRVAADVERLQRELVLRGNALRWLVKAAVVPLGSTPGVDHGKALDPKARLALSRFESPPMWWTELNVADDLRGDSPWQIALDALMSGASAAVPA